MLNILKMSGRPSSKLTAHRTHSRRSFLLKAGVLSAGIFLNGCIRKLTRTNAYKDIKVIMKGANAKAGHILRGKLSLPAPTTSRSVKTIIIGSGISGLSAARWLKKHGHENFELLELEGHSGGNSHHGQNEVSAFPLGAHYMTIINNEDQQLSDFLQECGVITGFKHKKPIYNEYYLCFDPEERLLINGQWQEGLIPEFGLGKQDRLDIQQFFELMETFRNAKGNDGRYAFDLPVDLSSADETYRALDRISFASYLHQQGLHTPYLLWYLNYCCKDDYGRKIEQVSAWAGIHYFASRRSEAANAESNAILTWPEGNGWLAKQLEAISQSHLRKNTMAYRIELRDGKAAVETFDVVNGTTSLILADNVIMATPQFVNQRLLAGNIQRSFDLKALQYAPWFVANITVSELPENKGMGLCWDNVAYDTASVGYVFAGQQNPGATPGKKVLSWYLPLADQEPNVARIAAYTRTPEQWMDILMPELEYMHPGITERTEEVTCWIWGHGMISPVVGYIWGPDRNAAQQPIDNLIYFAHTDLSGISIFEEAFHQGIHAANEILKKNG